MLSGACYSYPKKRRSREKHDHRLSDLDAEQLVRHRGPASGASEFTAGAGAVAAAIFAVFLWLLSFVHVADMLRRERPKARARPEPSPRLRKTKRLIQVAVFLASFVAILLLFRSLVTATGRPVGPEIPPLFPVMVMTPESGSAKYQATIVFHKDLADFLQKNPGHRYLVPRGDEQRLKSGLSVGSFEVEHRADGTGFRSMEIGAF